MKKYNLGLLMVVAGMILSGCQNETISGLSFKANSFYNRNLMAHVDSLNSNDSSNQQTSEQQESTNNHSTEDTPENQNTLDNAVAILNQDSATSSTNIESVNHTSSNNGGSTTKPSVVGQPSQPTPQPPVVEQPSQSTPKPPVAEQPNQSTLKPPVAEQPNQSTPKPPVVEQPSEPTPPVVEETKKPVDLLDWNYIKSTLIAKGESLGMIHESSMNRELDGWESPYQSSYMTVSNETVIGYISALLSDCANRGWIYFNLEWVVLSDGNVEVYLIR